jgi:hypothetical protein
MTPFSGRQEREGEPSGVFEPETVNNAENVY